MEALHDITRRRKRANAWFAAHGSKGYQAILDMEAAVYPNGALSRKEKELIATGISIVADCRSCMQWHIEQAASHGATLEEVVETIDVAIEMGGGPASVSARFAIDVLDDVFNTDR